MKYNFSLTKTFANPHRPCVLFTQTISVSHALGEYLRCALLLRRICPEWVGFYPITKCPLRRANPWVQDLCKHHSVFPYRVPPKAKIHKMAPWEEPPP